LAFLECPGNYTVLEYGGVKRKDCSSCIFPHDGYASSWNFIQIWLKKPIIWSGREQKTGTTGIQLNSVDMRIIPNKFEED
jgi:hypothetical protein